LPRRDQASTLPLGAFDGGGADVAHVPMKTEIVADAMQIQDIKSI